MRAFPRAPSLLDVGGFHVVICGGGVAAIEGMLRLRSLAGDRVEVTLVAPNDEFVYRPLAVQEAVGSGWGRRYQLWDVARDAGAEWVKDTLARVDSDGRVAHTGEGHELRYDALLVAVGGRLVADLEHVVTFRDAEAGRAGGNQPAARGGLPSGVMSVLRCTSRRGRHLLPHRLLQQPHGFEGVVWLVEPLEAHCLPVADGPDGAVPALDLDAACAPVSPHCRYHDDAVAGIDEPLDVHPESSDGLVEPLRDRAKGLDPRSGSRFKGIARVDPLDIWVQQVRLRWRGSGRPIRVDAADDRHVLLRNTRSPRRLRHGFQRNALPETLELAN
jgi:hypothetical protein